MAETARLIKQQLKLVNVSDMDDGSTKRSNMYFSDVLTAATDKQLYDLAEAIDSINKPVMESAQKVVTYDITG